MALYDWISTSFEDATATPATSATANEFSSLGVADVAGVAGVAVANSKTSLDPHQITLEDLLRMHPGVIEGCNLVDILSHAIPDDYEDLANPLILATFARTLKDAGDIKVVDVRHG